VRFLHSQYEAVREESGRSVRLVGTSQDVTEHKRAEEALQQSEERYRAVKAGRGIFSFPNQAHPNLAFSKCSATLEELAQMKVYDLVNTTRRA